MKHEEIFFTTSTDNGWNWAWFSADKPESLATRALQYPYETMNDYDKLPPEIALAIGNAVSDDLVPEFERVILTNAERYAIEHNGSFYRTIVNTQEYQFDGFSCGFDSETKTLCVNTSKPNEVLHEYNVWASIMP